MPMTDLELHEAARRVRIPATGWKPRIRAHVERARASTYSPLKPARMILWARLCNARPKSWRATTRAAPFT